MLLIKSKWEGDNMKYLMLLSVLLLNCFAAKTLDINEIEQQKDQWCWVGCSKMILDYHGIELSQGQIAEFGLGDSSINRPNYLWGAGQFSYNGTTQYQNGISKILENWGFGGYNYEWYAAEYTLTEEQWKQEIDDGHPFVINWSWYKGGGHFVVGMGYLDNGNYEITNPWFGTGYTVASYDWIKNRPDYSGNPINGSDDGVWNYTLITHKDPIINTTYELTVEHGEGSGAFTAGEEVTIVAAGSPLDSAFDSWSGIENLTGIFDSIAIFTMPAKNITLTALYKEHSEVSLLSDSFDVKRKRVRLSEQTLKMEGFEESQYDITLFSMSGRILFEKRINSALEKAVALPQLNQGVFILKITGKDLFYTTRVVK